MCRSSHVFNEEIIPAGQQDNNIGSDLPLRYRTEDSSLPTPKMSIWIDIGYRRQCELQLAAAVPHGQVCREGDGHD